MATSSSVTAATTTSDIPDVPPQNPSPSTKLAPLRPSKIRKLSPDTIAAIADSDSGISDTVASVAGDATPTTTATMAIVLVLPVNGGKPKSAAASKTAKSKMLVSGAGHPPPPRMVARSLSYPGEIERALQHLQSSDPHLAQLIDLHQTPTFDSFQSPFLALTKSIIYQQFAYKAAPQSIPGSSPSAAAKAAFFPMPCSLSPHNNSGKSGSRAAKRATFMT